MKRWINKIEKETTSFFGSYGFDSVFFPLSKGSGCFGA